MKAKKQDALALARRFGKPTLFIICICNPKWSEFERDLPPGVSIKDQPNLTARVFQLKLKRTTQRSHRAACAGAGQGPLLRY